MLQICIGSFIALSFFAFLLIWGALVMAGNADEAEIQESRRAKKIGRESVATASLRLDPELVPEKAGSGGIN